MDRWVNLLISKISPLTGGSEYCKVKKEKVKSSNI